MPEGLSVFATPQNSFSDNDANQIQNIASENNFHLLGVSSSSFNLSAALQHGSFTKDSK